MATLINQDGTDKNDVLTYDKGGDGVVYHTMAGNDKVTIAGDSIALVNDAGSDTITITGGSGHSIEGNGASVETIIIDGGAAVSAELGDGRDVVTINKSSGRTSTGASSSIRGGGWTDTFNVKEGAQNYQLYGEAGDDIFNIDGGKNMNFWGGAANDTFVVTGGSNNKLYGGDSDDVFEISAANQNMILGYGKDTVNVKAGDNQQIKGNLGINTINLLAGSGHVITSDIDQVASKKAGKEVGYGVDKVIIDGASQVTANLGDGKDEVEIKTGSGHMIYTEGWGDTVTISGTVSDSAIDTGAGDDIVIINGGTNNTIVVGEGNDTITLNDGSVGVLNGESGTNTITVNGGSAESIIGAFVGGTATGNNVITITGGSVTGESIIGSTNERGGATNNNTVTITGGSFGKNEEGQAITSVYGGKNDYDVVNNNIVSVSAGDFAAIYGGHQGVNVTGSTGVAIGNQVIVEGTATADIVYGAKGTGQVNDNKVTIAGQARVGQVIGGHSTNVAAYQNPVTIKGAAIVEGAVIGSICDDSNAYNSTVIITENATVGSVVGSHIRNTVNNSGLSAGTTVTLSGDAVVKGDVYGVKIDQPNAYQRANKINLMENAVVEGSIIGTYSKNGSISDMDVYVTGGSVTNYKASQDTLITGESGYIIGLMGGVDKFVSGASVNMSAGEAAVLCGAIATGKSSIGSIQVNLSGGSVAAIDGAYSDIGSINGVFVTVTGGKIVSDIEGLEAHVLGGRTRTGEIGFTNVSITNMDQSELQVIGGQAVNGNDGEMLSGKLNGTTVIVKNSTVRMVNGGQNLGLGNVQGATVTVDTSKVSADLATADLAKLEDQLGYAVVGGVGQGQEVAGNRVQVIGGQVSAVYGGVNKSEQGISDSNNVVLNNGVIVNYNVYGGVSVGGTVRGSGITINEATIMGYDAAVGDGGHAVGAASQSGLVTGNGIYMAKGDVYRLTGGSSVTGIVTENSVTLNTGSTVAIAEGGYSENGQVVKNNVTTRGGTVTDTVYAGRVVENNAELDIKAVVNGNKAELIGSELRDVYGGMAVTSGDVTNNIVSITSATVKGSVWGGYTASGSAYNNSVSIYDSVVEGNVYSSVGTVENPSTIMGENNLVIAGADRMGDISIYGNTAQVKGTIYGGYGIDTINLYGCTINAIETGAGNDTITTQGATVGTIDGGDGDDIIGINGETVNSIAGGEGNDTIHLSACDVALVNAGAGNDTITVNDAESVRITGGAGNDTYKFWKLKDDASYIINEKGVSGDDKEVFDFQNYNEEDITISYGDSDLKFKTENGATVTVKNYKEMGYYEILFKDGALAYIKPPIYTSQLQAAAVSFEDSSVATATESYEAEDNKVMVFGSK